MAVSVQSFTQLVENQVAAIQGYCSALLDFTIGSVLRALVEAVGSVALFLQAEALQVAALTRAATSNGTDLDSFFAQFGFTRLQPTNSVGAVTLSRFTASQQATVPVGTLVQSFDGSQQFTIVADTTNTSYNATLSAYAIPAGTTSLTIAAQSVTASASANVAAGTITQIVTVIQYVDTVTNAYAFSEGSNAETDPAYRARFVLYLASLSRATRAAVSYAILTFPGLSSYSLVENASTAGVTQYGYFYTVVDDGSGSPSPTFTSGVYSAVDAVRPLGTYFSVLGPSDITANVVVTIATAASYVHSNVVSTVQAALAAYINSLGLGGSLSYSRLIQVAYDASPGVTNVTGLTLNSATSDLAATSQQRILAGSVSVS